MPNLEPLLYPVMNGLYLRFFSHFMDCFNEQAVPARLTIKVNQVLELCSSPCSYGSSRSSTQRYVPVPDLSPASIVIFKLKQKPVSGEKRGDG